MKRSGIIVISIGILLMVITLELITGKVSVVGITMIAALVIIVVAFDPKQIREMTIDFKATTLKLKQAAAQVEITTEQFNKTVDAFLAYNLADFQNQGFFDETVPWRTGERFVEEAIRMHAISESHDDDIVPLISAAQQKVFDLFMLSMAREFPEIYNDVRRSISSGYNDVNIGPKIKQDKPVVDFKALRELENKLPSNEVKLRWRGEVDSLLAFYNRHYSNEKDA